MGFKRTSEGRIFFTSSGEDAGAAATTVAPLKDAPHKEKTAPHKENGRESGHENAAGVRPRPIDYRTLAQPQASASGASSNSPSNAPLNPSTQFQILSLLRALNEKLSAGQQERTRLREDIDNYRRQIEDLEIKAARTARTQAELEQKIGEKGAAGKADTAQKLAQETRAAMEETRALVTALENKAREAERRHSAAEKALKNAAPEKFGELVRRIEETENRQDSLSEKLGKALVEQGRLARQIEKASEDRARFMRKIERIEETVLQTRDALSSRAMVLLTDQKVARVDSDAPQQVLDQVLAAPAAAATDADEAAVTGIFAGVMGVLLVLALMAFALAVLWRAGYLDPLMRGNADKAVVLDRPIGEESATAAPQTRIEPNWQEQDNTGQFTPAPLQQEPLQPAPAVETPDARDSGNGQERSPESAPADERSMMDMLEHDPQKLAAVLNAIEPGEVPAAETPVAETPIAEIQEPAQAPKPTSEPAKTATPAPDNAELRSLIKPDRGLPEAARALEDRAFDGTPEAQHDLAAIYTAGYAGVKQDYRRAAFWFEQAAKRGVANAAYNLGVLYHQGLGTKADMAKAITWYENAATLHHPEAEYNLGIAYVQGVGVGYDPQKAAGYFESAAQQDVPEAAYNLGLIYENGLLGAADPARAAEWYQRAAEKGSAEAREALRQLRRAQGNTAAAAPVSLVPSANSATNATHTDAASDDPATLKRIQDNLIRVGLYPGPADGQRTPQMDDAIRAYQGASGLPADGVPSAALLAHMQSRGPVSFTTPSAQ